MVSVGDKVIVFGAGSDFAHAVKLTTPNIGDTVTLYPLPDETQIAVPNLTFDLDNYVFVTPSFQFAGFNFNVDFDFQLLLLALEKFVTGDYFYGTGWPDDWGGWEFSEWHSSGFTYSYGTAAAPCGPSGFTAGYAHTFWSGHCHNCGIYLYFTKTFSGPASGFSCYLKNDSMDRITIYLNGTLIYQTHSDKCIYYSYMFGSELRDFEIKIRFGSIWSEANYVNQHYYFSHLYFYA